MGNQISDSPFVRCQKQRYQLPRFIIQGVFMFIALRSLGDNSQIGAAGSVMNLIDSIW